MAHRKFDRVQETTSGTGTGALTLAGASTRMRTFASVLTNADTCYVLIEHGSAGEWEVCLATYNAGTISRGAVLASSTGAAVSFTAGNKTVSLIAPASKMIVEDNNGDIVVTRDVTVGRDIKLPLDRYVYINGIAALGRSTTFTYVYEVAGLLSLWLSAARNVHDADWHNFRKADHSTALMDLTATYLRPGADITQDFGAAALRWKIGYFQNVVAGGLEVSTGDLYISRTSSANGFIVRPNSVGFKELNFGVVGGGALEVLRCNAAVVNFQSITTTASAANAYLDNATGNSILRSTSSLAYKRDVETLESWRADDFIEKARPIWYRSTSKADNPQWGWFGFAAEEMAEIDPALVQWGYQDEDWEEVEVTETETVTKYREEMREVEFEPGLEIRDTATGQLKRSIIRPVKVPYEEAVETKRLERRLKEGAGLKPDGVAYERITVMLTDVARRQGEEIAALKVEIDALKATVAALAKP